MSAKRLITDQIRSASFEIKFFFGLFLFLVLSEVFRFGDPFYEGGSYVAYVKSMLFDGDFNILLYMPEALSQVVTKKGMHPDFHTEVQTPFLMILYLMERALFWVTGNITTLTEKHPLGMHLVGFSLNFICLYVTHLFLRKTSRLLDLKYELFDFLTFITGSVLLYFSFFIMSCVEVLALPIFTYVLYNFFKLRLKGTFHLMTVAPCLGFLICSNPTFIPFVLYLAFVFIWHLVNRKEWRSILIFGCVLALLPLAQALNFYVKYGIIFDPGGAARLFFDVSFYQAIYKVFYVYMVTDFWRSPLSLLGLVGGISYLWSLRSKGFMTKIDFWAFSLSILAAVYVMMFFIGNVVESHLSGRHFLRVAPFFILGLSFLRSEIFKNKIIVRFLQVSFAVWGAIFVFGFVANDILSPFYQAYRSFPPLHLLGEVYDKYFGFVEYRYQVVASNLHLFLFYSLIVTLFVFLVRRFNKKISLFIFSMIFLSYPVMSVINWQNAPARVEELASDGFYADKTMGHGAEIFLFDYFLDMAMYIYLSNQGEFDEKLNARLNIFFNRVEEQVIQSSPSFQQRLDQRSMDQSYWLKDDGGRHDFRREFDGELHSKPQLRRSKD